VKKAIGIDLKPYDWSMDVKNIYEHALELFRAKGGGKMGDKIIQLSNQLAKSRIFIT
jgi:hypothetical protein